MAEDPLSKIRRVSKSCLMATCFDRIQFKESDRKEVREKGGMETVDETIYFDPLYVSKADDRTLAFTLAHEHGHCELEPGGDYAQDENDADDHALHQLFESGWSLIEAERCLADWRSHLEWYFESTNQPRPEDLDASTSLLTLLCAEIWMDCVQG